MTKFMAAFWTSIMAWGSGGGSSSPALERKAYLMDCS